MQHFGAPAIMALTVGISLLGLFDKSCDTDTLGDIIDHLFFRDLHNLHTHLTTVHSNP